MRARARVCTCLFRSVHITRVYAWRVWVWGWYVQGNERGLCVTCWEDWCVHLRSGTSKGANDVNVFTHFYMYVYNKRLMV